jgi:hypothetical protein
MKPERDPANPTPEELRETAASEGLMASEKETDPEFQDLLEDDEFEDDLELEPDAERVDVPTEDDG